MRNGIMYKKACECFWDQKHLNIIIFTTKNHFLLHLLIIFVSFIEKISLLSIIYSYWDSTLIIIVS